MSSRQLLGRVRRRAKQSVTWLRGWVYWLRRRLRPPAGPATGAIEHDRGRGADRLPADAPDSLLAENEHGVYCVPRASMHRLVSRTILDSRVWEADTIELLRAADPAGDIVHAGTFFGDFLPALSRSRNEGALVWAFEPNRENYECTRVTIAINELSNVVLGDSGLDAASRRAFLKVSDRAGVPLGGGSKLVRDPAKARWTESEKVSLVALDDVLGAERRVAAIHLDVEGYEQQALAGALGIVARWRPLIVLETTPSPQWLQQHLEPLGYSVEGTVDKNTVLRASPAGPAMTPEAVGPGLEQES